MARKLKSDKLLFLATLLLVCSSVVMVYSASAVLAMDQYEQPYFFLFKQVTWAVLGVCLLLFAMRVDYRKLKQPVVIWTALGLSTLALIAVLFGPPINGTRRWFGFAGVGVQPSELAKQDDRRRSSPAWMWRRSDCWSHGWKVDTTAAA